MKQHFESIQRKLEEEILELKTRNEEHCQAVIRLEEENKDLRQAVTRSEEENKDLRHAVTYLKNENGNLRQTSIQVQRERGELRRIISQHMVIHDTSPVQIDRNNEDTEEPRNKRAVELWENSHYWSVYW